MEAANKSADNAEKIAEVQQALVSYGQQYGLRGLEGRIQRGLDPAGMLAVPETRAKLEKIAQALGADVKEVIRLTNELHVGGIWKNADALAKNEDPAVQSWTVLGEVCVSGKEEESDLTEDQFVADMERVNRLLDEAIQDPQGFRQRAKENMVDRSSQKFTVEDGVPISKLDDGFLSMAICGYKSGIVEDKDGLLFVGANALNYEALGLKVVEREDRGRMATFYQDPHGKDVIKKLYPGFAIVFGDKEIAKKLARTVIK